MIDPTLLEALSDSDLPELDITFNIITVPPGSDGLPLASGNVAADKKLFDESEIDVDDMPDLDSNLPSSISIPPSIHPADDLNKSSIPAASIPAVFDEKKMKSSVEKQDDLIDVVVYASKQDDVWVGDLMRDGRWKRVEFIGPYADLYGDKSSSTMTSWGKFVLNQLGGRSSSSSRCGSILLMEIGSQITQDIICKWIDTSSIVGMLSFSDYFVAMTGEFLPPSNRIRTLTNRVIRINGNGNGSSLIARAMSLATVSDIYFDHCLPTLIDLMMPE